MATVDIRTGDAEVQRMPNATTEDEERSARPIHPDVEYSVDDASGEERVFKTPGAAAAFAIALAMSGREVHLDVLIWSEDGARAYGGDDAVERYREDPEASISDRIVIRAESIGSVA